MLDGDACDQTVGGGANHHPAAAAAEIEERPPRNWRWERQVHQLPLRPDARVPECFLYQLLVEHDVRAYSYTPPDVYVWGVRPPLKQSYYN